MNATEAIRLNKCHISIFMKKLLRKNIRGWMKTKEAFLHKIAKVKT